MHIEPSITHLWTFRQPAIIDQGVTARFESVLTEQELLEFGDLKTNEIRFERTAARGITRLVLSRYLSCDPQSISFTRNSLGRPSVFNQSIPPIHFSLSHTKGFIALALSSNSELGVDVERVDLDLDVMPLFDQVLTPEETKKILELSNSHHAMSRRFYEYWTLKEALLKAKGLGLSGSLTRLSFKLETEGHVRLQSLDPSLAIDSEWKFALLTPTTEHCLAIATRSNQPVEYQQFDFTPADFF